MPKKTAMVLHNNLNYNDHYIIKQLAKEFEGEFSCIGENIEQYKAFTVPVTRALKKLVKMKKKLQKLYLQTAIY